MFGIPLHTYFKVLEGVSFAATIALAIFAWRALSQVTVAKRDLQVRVEREAKSAAVAQMDKWADTIIPTGSESMVAMRSIKLEPMPCDLQYFDLPELLARNSAVLNSHQDEFADKLNANPALKEQVINICNMVEASATVFLSGVADEETAFSALGESLCEFVDWMWPVYCGFRRERRESDRYSNSIALYTKWSSRRKHLALMLQRHQITMELAKVSAAAARIPPIGES